ncbi:hypothetical protein Mal4_19450 [Maioricimonas rarisocia]|uniref:Uncharacterized protein n=1 Tax=Maioricimonas rarisocia TaxID=2528026 RepID=A0A517Z567_9PLAN|nr:HNH endonuclease [Maioricimonas rarisocia]QDU37630.1 hypothetical protein Mal4_19450 [Maioricimonas rarisocia]
MTSREEILEAFGRINVWSRGTERAPHKPLLVLYALGRLSRGEPPSIPFREVAPRLTELLREFGPSRKSFHPEYPFWRLQNDGIWIVDQTDSLLRRKGQTDVPKRELLAHDVHARFPEHILARLRCEPELLAEVALRLLDSHFPASLHEDILDAVGLETRLTETVTRRKRDPDFRHRVLAVYEYGCAVCGFDVRLGRHTLGIEAAHIQWHQAGGPDAECNGLALCSLHHKAFDLGAFTIQPDSVLLVSNEAHGQQGFDEWLLRFHGRSIRRPSGDDHLPAARFLAWHQREVFKRPPRDVRQSS